VKISSASSFRPFGRGGGGGGGRKPPEGLSSLSLSFGPFGRGGGGGGGRKPPEGLLGTDSSSFVLIFGRGGGGDGGGALTLIFFDDLVVEGFLGLEG